MSVGNMPVEKDNIGGDVKKNAKKRIASYICAAAAVCMVLAGLIKSFSSDGGSAGELSVSGFAFNTTYEISAGSGGSKELLNECIALCAEFEKVFSRTLKGSELFNINEVEDMYAEAVKKGIGKAPYSEKESSAISRMVKDMAGAENDADFEVNGDGSISFYVSDMLAEVLKKGLYYSKISDGGFDISIEPVSSMWDFTADNPKIPDKAKIADAAKLVNYKDLALDGNRLTFKKPGMGVDLGAIAKGYIADRLKERLKDGGVESGIISLGGNVACIGKRIDGEPFNIGIQRPFAERNSTISAVSVDDASVVSSGTYERYFKLDGRLYHHLLDPKTGYPFDNGLTSVTIISKKSVDGDGLSTACFALGIDKGMRLINGLSDTYALFVDSDGGMHYSDGFKEMESDYEE